MKTFFSRHKRLHLWLLGDLAALAAYYLLRENRALMNALTSGFTGPLQRALGRLCSCVPFSVMEVLSTVLVLGAVGYVIGSVCVIVKAKGERWKRAYGCILGFFCAGLSLAALFCLLWGICFWSDSFQDRSGLYAQPVSGENLLRVTAFFADNLSEAAPLVDRDESGLFHVSREEILRDAPRVYDGAEAIWPFLEFDDTGVKPMAYSWLMSRMDFTGFYCSYTGEANVNIDSPACLLPSTAAHEMAHQRLIASEQECNFLGVVASVNSAIPAYVYSGWLMGYIYLGNALYSANPEAYRLIRDALPEEVQRDLADNNAYWDQFRDTVTTAVSNKVYDGILKSYGENRGIRSYGAMVDLLVAYYAPQLE